MKGFLPAIVTAAVVVAGVAVSLLTARPLQPPEAQVIARIEERVSQAQSMLHRYDPTDAALTGLLETAGSRPDEPATDAQAHLKQRSALIGEALAIVQAALRDGQQAGVEHAGAMRLETVLLYSQADLLRREAELHRARADAARTRFSSALGSWREVDTLIQSLQRESGAGQADASLADRIAGLRSRRQEVAASIEAAQPELQQLTQAIATHESRIAESKARAEEAQRRMLALEDAGIDASDPRSLEQFITRYEESSEAFRTDSLELSVLESGAIRNARPDTDEEEEFLAAPLGPIQPGREMTPERGLVALRTDLAAMEAVLRTRNELLGQLDGQIERLTRREQELSERLSRLEASRATPAGQALDEARAAVAATIEADRWEAEALAIIVDRGLPSAARATRTAGAAAAHARSMHTRYMPDLPAPDVSFLSGHAKVLEGDLHYLAARVHVQRASDLPRHHELLRGASEMGLAAADLLADPATQRPSVVLNVRPGQDEDLPAPAVQQEDVPAAAVQADAAAAAAEEARQEAVRSAQTALSAYQGADSDLKQMWGLHANMAAVHYLLAEVTEGLQAQRHREDALREYERAVGDRRDQPEARPYLRILEGLSQPRATPAEADAF